METLRIVMVNAARRIELEGPQEIVLEQLDDMRAWVDAPGQRPTEKDPEHPAGLNERVTLRSFLAAKRPDNTYEAIAVLLAYNKSHEGKQELSTDEIRVAMIQSAIRPPGAMGQAMADCRRRYGYVEVGSTRGLWRLSHQGETLVEIDLPRAKG
jgi:hypothetical protein